MDNLTDFVRVKAPGPLEWELERLKRIEAAAKWLIDRIDNWLVVTTEMSPSGIRDAVDQLRKAVRR